MNHTEPFDLSAKPGLDDLLGQASRDLGQYFANPAAEPAALQAALAGLHRTGDVLRGLSLDGAAVFCGAIEKLLQELAAGTLSPSTAYSGIIKRALLSLTHYLNALADGASNAALRLFPQYQELQQARGMEMAFEVDLFFPDLQVELPPAVLAQAPEPAPLARIKAERSRYQTALLKWLRQDHPAEALQSMHSAVQAVMGCVPQNQQRAFWWVASALLDCLSCHDLDTEQSSRRLLGRIDRQMKSLAEGQPVDTSAILHELLYLIACSQPVSDAVAAVKRVYALESYLPQADILPARETDPVLNLMRTQLEAAKESWEQYSRESSVMPSFANQLRQLAVLAEQLDRNTLQHLCHQIHSISAQANSVEQTQRLAMDMAMALLLLGSGIEHYRQLGDEFQEQAHILGQRLQADIAGTAQDENKLADLVALQCRMEAPSVTAVLLSEIQLDLQHVEQGLNALVGDRGKDQGDTAAKSPPGAAKPALPLGQMVKLLHQTQNGLHFLAQQRPEPLLRVLQQAVNYYAEGGRPTRDEIHTIAAALSALQAYVKNLAQQQNLDTAQLDAALQDMQTLPQSTIAQAPDGQALGAGQTVARPAPRDGDDLLEVFLEEAQEVFGSMRANLEIIQLQPESREPLVSIRRGFHTLKGSGRMVGLTDLAEVAWAVERAMNKWLQQENKPATPDLLKFMLDAKTAFQGWVDSLHTQGSAQIEADELVTTARRIESDLEEMPVAQPGGSVAATTPAAVSTIATVQPAAPGAEPEQQPVVIGAVTLAPALFGIATEEAAQHVASLLRHLADLRARRQHSVSYDFTLAAHTLAGVNRTMGFIQLAELAYALEQWLEQRIGQPLALTDVQLALLERVIAALQDMSMAVRRRQEPQAQPELIAQLQADQTAPAAKTPALQVPETTAQPASPAMEERQAQDDMDEQLLPVFLEEADDLYPQIGNGMRAWREQPEDKLLGRGLQRNLHTL